MGSKSLSLLFEEEDDINILKRVELPHDLICFRILTRLPIKPVLRFKSVSKQWYSTLSSYQFGNSHMKLYSSISPLSPTHHVLIQTSKTYQLFTYNEDDEIDSKSGRHGLFRLDHDFDVRGRNDNDNDAREIALCSTGHGNYAIRSVDKGNKLLLLGSFNGLVCLGSRYDFILWNPITRESKRYESNTDSVLNSSTTCRVSWGFGYVSSIDEYKVVRIIELPLTLEIMVHVFSFKSNTWRRIDPKVYENVISLRSSFKTALIFDNVHRYLFHVNRGVVCDERVHWIVAKTDVAGRRVVSFDFVRETFETCHNVDAGRFTCVVRGCLSTFEGNMRGDTGVCIYKRYSEGDENEVSIYKEEQSIFLSRALSLEYCSDLIDFSKNGKFVILKGQRIGLIDSVLKTYKELTMLQENWEMHFTSYDPSLASPLVVASIVVSQ